MNQRPSRLLLALPLLVLSVPDLALAAESYDNCTGFITSLPAVISTQGTWCLKQDLTTAITSGAAITIETNNVTLDCNDFKIGGLAAGLSTEAMGLSVVSRLNTTVKHCHFRGFQLGVALVGNVGGGHVVQDNRFDGNTAIGALVQGDGSVVRRNRVLNTGGNTSGGFAEGIVVGYSVDVMDNTVSSVKATVGSNGSARGIDASGNVSGTISGNMVRDLTKAGSGEATAVLLSGALRVTVRGNDLVGDPLDVGASGLHCDDSTSQAADNVINGFATGISGCINGGGNVINP